MFCFLTGFGFVLNYYVDAKLEAVLGLRFEPYFFVVDATPLFTSIERS